MLRPMGFKGANDRGGSFALVLFDLVKFSLRRSAREGSACFLRGGQVRGSAQILSKT